MFFKNLSVYLLKDASSILAPVLAENLSQHVLQPCGPCDPQSIGWVSPRAGDQIVYCVGKQMLLALGIEQKILPSSVINRTANDKAKAIEENEGRRVGRKELRELKESVAIELLPRAFTRRSTTFGWIDKEHGWLVVDASSPAKAEAFIEFLHKSVEGIPVSLVKTQVSPSSGMTGWAASGEAPDGFSIDHDLSLVSAEHAQVKYVKHSLEGKEIRDHIAEGKVVTRLGMTWGDRISFVLTEQFQFKRVEFLDILKEENEAQAENEEERFELDFVLMTGELARMLENMTTALDGQVTS